MSYQPYKPSSTYTKKYVQPETTVTYEDPDYTEYTTTKITTKPTKFVPVN